MFSDKLSGVRPYHSSSCSIVRTFSVVEILTSKHLSTSLGVILRNMKDAALRLLSRVVSAPQRH